jgi:menaquinone-dependent protoporphyrinogen IX oxidase
MKIYNKNCQKQSDHVNQWLTTKQLAEYLGRSPNAIRMLVFHGQLLVHARLGRFNYFDKFKIDELMKSKGDRYEH